MKVDNPLRILVTGSSAGLGKNIGDLLWQCGHDVVDFDLTIGDDVCSPNGAALRETLGHLDVLVNNAGVNDGAWFEDVTEEQMARVMDVNAFGIVKMTQAVLPLLIASKGTVINIVSNAAKVPMTASLAYNMSKAAALMATKQMARELMPRYGITVFSISPNKLAGTDMSKEIEERTCRIRGWTPEYEREYQLSALPCGEETDPHAVAKMITGIINSGDMRFHHGCDIPFGGPNQ